MVYNQSSSEKSSDDVPRNQREDESTLISRMTTHKNYIINDQFLGFYHSSVVCILFFASLDGKILLYKVNQSISRYNKCLIWERWSWFWATLQSLLRGGCKHRFDSLFLCHFRAILGHFWAISGPFLEHFLAIIFRSGNLSAISGTLLYTSSKMVRKGPRNVPKIICGGIKKILGGFLLINFHFLVYFNNFSPFSDFFRVAIIQRGFFVECRCIFASKK